MKRNAGLANRKTLSITRHSDHYIQANPVEGRQDQWGNIVKERVEEAKVRARKNNDVVLAEVAGIVTRWTASHNRIPVQGRQYPRVLRRHYRVYGEGRHCQGKLLCQMSFDGWFPGLIGRNILLKSKREKMRKVHLAALRSYQLPRVALLQNTEGVREKQLPLH